MNSELLVASVQWRWVGMHMGIGIDAGWVATSPSAVRKPCFAVINLFQFVYFPE